MWEETTIKSKINGGIKMKEKFKIGDKIIVSIDNTHNEDNNGNKGTIEDMDGSDIPYLIMFDDVEYGVWIEKVELLKGCKPDNMKRFMVYGTSCDNKSNLLKTEKELKEKLKKCVNDDDWTGRIIGYKLTPIYEAELTTRLKVFKVPKITKIKR